MRNENGVTFKALIPGKARVTLVDLRDHVEVFEVIVIATVEK